MKSAARDKLAARCRRTASAILNEPPEGALTSGTITINGRRA